MPRSASGLQRSSRHQAQYLSPFAVTPLVGEGSPLHSTSNSNGGNGQNICGAIVPVHAVTRDPLQLQEGPSFHPDNRTSYQLGPPLDSSDQQHLSGPSDPLAVPEDIARRERNLETKLLPPRHRRPRNRQVQNDTGSTSIVIEGDTISIHALSPFTSAGDIEERFSRLGFRAHALSKISVLREEKTALVQFSHFHLAQAAFFLIRQQSTESEQVKPAGGTDTPPLGSAPETGVLQPDVIDLTHDDGLPVSQPLQMYDPYEGFNREVYDDLMESDSDSESEALPPSRAISSPLTQGTSTTDGSQTEGIQRYDLGHLNATARELMQTASKAYTTSPGHKQRVRLEGRVRLRHRGQELVQHTDKSGVTIVPIPKSAFNHPRRVLHPESAELPLMTVSMRGDLQFFHRTQRYRLSKFSIPNQNAYRHVVDAVIAGDRAIVAYTDGPSQLSVVSLKEDHAPTLTDLDHRPHTRDSESGPIAAVNCLTIDSSVDEATHIFTGGFDRRIRRWTVTPSQRSLWATSCDIFGLGTIPEALAYRRERASLLIATSKKMLAVDLKHPMSRPLTFRVSNAIHQIHLHKQAPDVTILEVDNLDFQIQVFDQRKQSGFDRVPDAYFGTRHGNGVPARFSRGDTRLNEFAKGFDDGTVRIWDYRNTKLPVLARTYSDLGPIVHTSYLNRNTVSYGKQGLIFLTK